MKILILSDVNSPHTVKWVRGLVMSEVKVQLFSLSFPEKDWFSSLGVACQSLAVSNQLQQKQSISQKLVYLKGVKMIRKMVQSFDPDILHAHYATSYGLLGRRVGFSPFVVSFWGSDIQDFPSRGFLHKKILSYVLSNNTTICVTSKAMQRDVTTYFSKSSKHIPFGINLAAFSKSKEKQAIYTIGTVKSLEDVYGIDLLIRSYDAYRKIAKRASQLLIFGKGTKKKELTQLVDELNLSDFVQFKGYKEHEHIAEAYQSFDVFAALSHRESFGVSVLEASACHLPVVVSRASGFEEVVLEAETGFRIENTDLNQIAAKFLYFEDEKERKQFGDRGAKFVQTAYDFELNLKQQLAVYQEIVKR